MRHELARTSLLPLTVVVLFVCAPSVRAQEGPPSVITTSARGEVKVVPDHAQIQVTVRTRATSAVAAASENATKQAAVVGALRALGLADSQISTLAYSVTPETRNDRTDQTPHIVSYFVSNTVSVEVSDLSLIGKILDAAIGSGANEVSSVSLYRGDTENVYQQALAIAAKNARAEAQAMAAAARGRIGLLLEMNSGGLNSPSFGAQGARTMSLVSAETPIMPGQQVISASVTARWTFVPDP